jgi:hypothetical protein
MANQLESLAIDDSGAIGIEIVLTEAGRMQVQHWMPAMIARHLDLDGFRNEGVKVVDNRTGRWQMPMRSYPAFDAAPEPVVCSQREK